MEGYDSSNSLRKHIGRLSRWIKTLSSIVHCDKDGEQIINDKYEEWQVMDQLLLG